jgi:ubiquinone/menaquinone biosynthesis C-methylase UbiE
VCGLKNNRWAISAHDLEWSQGDTENLRFPDTELDVALCQSALFFFTDPGRAVAEMARVVVPRGVVALQTYAPWLSSRPMAPSSS